MPQSYAESVEWFSTWFDSPYYHLLYHDRDHNEAQHFLDNLLRHLHPKPHERLLDLACGKGRHAIYLSQQGYDVTGIDLSAQSIRYACQFEHERLHFFRHDMRAPLPHGPFDFILNLFTSFGYFDEEAENVVALRNAADALQHGGKLVIDFLNTERTVRELVAREEKQIRITEKTPLAIRTKKYQLDKETYTRMALTQVWKRDWWQAVIPLVVLLLPAAVSFSWWWVVAAVTVTVLYVLVRSAQVTGVTQLEQSKFLFERMSYEFEPRYIAMRANEKDQPRGLNWDMIERVRRDKDAYVMYLKQPDVTDHVSGWRAWLAKLMWVPVFLYVPTRVFNAGKDQQLFENLLRRKGFIGTEAAAPKAA